MGCPKKHCVVFIHQKRRRRAVSSTRARVSNVARTGAQSAGLANVNIQVPINLGDAQAFNRSSGNSVSNLL
ncbi:hypothetical protein ADL26_05280 [Thermoactinomyces vulgaris]|jgi:hypothetical protein|uniref:Uncharacterized protein n=1 Tax=Laceyella sediminis TaxID=573074 RepID=A0ABX5EMJ3_9BACL|nr:hypothetical protein [Laceyella sediminis]KPC76713.1 hypothetical protein ADL26_05280 [Thermoactinomyces vulgaris]PRZ13532.1 hypothetical protein CLV36_10829 [Laceyella sediminis]